MPLVATAEPGAHVLSATAYSKSVLRVAAETMKRDFANIHYFPSFEIITGAFNRGAYYASDLRNVVEDGVDHVMRLFYEHYGADASTHAGTPATAGPSRVDVAALSEQINDVLCDEEMLDSEVV